jgi:hypothetical protein
MSIPEIALIINGSKEIIIHGAVQIPVITTD